MEQKVPPNSNTLGSQGQFYARASPINSPPPMATAKMNSFQEVPAPDDYYNAAVSPAGDPTDAISPAGVLYDLEKGVKRDPLQIEVKHDYYGEQAEQFLKKEPNMNVSRDDEESDEDVESGTRRRRKRRKKKRKEDKSFAPSDQRLQYRIHDVPPWYLTIVLGFQHYLVMFGATVTNPLVLASSLCIAKDDNLSTSLLIGTIFFVSGIVTLMQTCLGIRLPIVQGGTFTFVTPSIAILSLEKWKCPEADVTTTTGLTTIGTSISPLPYSFINGTDDSSDYQWMSRIREIQGAIIIASFVQIFIGITGLMGFLLKFIGPLAVAPTVALAGLALFQAASGFASQQWWIALVTILLIATFSQYTKNFEVPCFHFNRREGCTRVNFPLFRLFPVILAITITWALCAILTVAGVFPDDPNSWGHGAKTSLHIDVMDKAPWFRIPYPFQWGMPTASAASVLGMLSGVLASMLESLGDYYACARMADAPPPPLHAVNRAICIEGIGCVIAGMFGTSSGTTSYSENIGAIGITKVASIRVIQVGAIMMIVMGTFGKFGALFVTIPKPIIGGVFIVMFGMITAVGISNLQFVDLNSTRNLFIIGFTFFFGLTLPEYMKANPKAIQTGVPVLDQIFTVLLSTHMFIGGLTGFVLDNTIPGTDEERGLLKWRHTLISSKPSRTVTDVADDSEIMRRTYDIPYITPYLEKYNWARYIPFLPTFDEGLLDFMCTPRRRRGNKKKDRQREATPNRRDSAARVEVDENGHHSTAV